MALTAASFSSSESMANPGTITFVDTSTGTDLTLTNRKIFIRLANGNWLNSDGTESTTVVGIDWSYSELSITFTDLISQSTTPFVEVIWYAGSTATYTDSDEFCWNFYDYEFALQLLQGQTSNPGIVQDTNYLNNFYAFIVNIFCEENAILWGGDIYSAQGAANRNNFFIVNENDFF